MSRWLGLWLIAASLLLAPAARADALQEVQSQLQPAAVLRGRFEQEKQVQGFRNPLRSSGRFLIAHQRGVIWDTEQPFASSLVISAAGLRLDDQDQAGVPEQALQRINRILVALIGGSIESLRSEFELAAEVGEQGWTLRLQARDPQLAQRLRDLRIAGSQWVEQVDFDDAQGNHTRLRFSAQTVEPAQLSAQEAARLD